MNIDPGSVSAEEEHPEVEEISALSEGILPGDRVDDVRAHVMGCELCSAVHDSLDEIRGLLGELPGPVRMPDDVVARLDAALAEEALSIAATTGMGHAPDLPDTREPGDARERARAEDAAFARHGTYDSGHADDTGRLAGGSASRADLSAGAGHQRRPVTGPARGPQSGPGRRPPGRRRRWPLVLLSAGCGALTLGLGAYLVSTVDSPRSASGSATASDQGARAEKYATSDQVYTESNLEPHVRDLLAGKPRTPGKPEADGEGTGQGDSRTPKPMVRPRDSGGLATAPATALPQCVLDATQRGSETPIATDTGEYQGTPVGVVVLPDRSDSRRVTVFLVDSGCQTTDPAGTGTVLLKRTVPRP